jgi:type II secretory pathway pseudopilin PulG
MTNASLKPRIGADEEMKRSVLIIVNPRPLKGCDPGSERAEQSMKNWRTSPRDSAGFTLLEVMVSLILGMMIVGGVMGGISMSLRYSQQVQKRLYESAVIQAAAEHLLTRPQDLELGSVILEDFPGSPRVGVEAMPVDIGDRQPEREQRSNLYRVLLSYANQRVEFSLQLPPEKEGKL